MKALEAIVNVVRTGHFLSNADFDQYKAHLRATGNLKKLRKVLLDTGKFDQSLEDELIQHAVDDRDWCSVHAPYFFDRASNEMKLKLLSNAIEIIPSYGMSILTKVSPSLKQAIHDAVQYSQKERPSMYQHTIDFFSENVKPITNLFRWENQYQAKHHLAILEEFPELFPRTATKSTIVQNAIMVAYHEDTLSDARKIIKKHNVTVDGSLAYSLIALLVDNLHYSWRGHDKCVLETVNEYPHLRQNIRSGLILGLIQTESPYHIERIATKELTEKLKIDWNDILEQRFSRGLVDNSYQRIKEFITAENYRERNAEYQEKMFLIFSGKLTQPYFAEAAKILADTTIDLSNRVLMEAHLNSKVPSIIHEVTKSPEYDLRILFGLYSAFEKVCSEESIALIQQKSNEAILRLKQIHSYHANQYRSLPISDEAKTHLDFLAPKEPPHPEDPLRFSVVRRAMSYLSM